MATLEKAISIALKAHLGTLDKAGAPYVLHPLRLMLQMDTPAEMMTAVLHDVVEDSDFSLAILRENGFSEEILEALDCLTRKPDEPYEAYISRVAVNPVARKVKIADLTDNLNLTRVRKLTDRDWKRIQRYHRAIRTLQGRKPLLPAPKKEPYTLFLGEL